MLIHAFFNLQSTLENSPIEQSHMSTLDGLNYELQLKITEEETLELPRPQFPQHHPTMGDIIYFAVICSGKVFWRLKMILRWQLLLHF